MADEKQEDKAKNKPEWGGFKGTIVKGSLKEDDGKLLAVGRTAEGKEHHLVAYPHQKNGAEALRAAHESGKEVVVRGPMLGSSNKGTFHFGAAMIKDPGAPKAEKRELTAEEKAAKAEERAAQMAARDKSQFPVKVGSVAEGDTITVDGNEFDVTGLGREFEIDKDNVGSIAERFGGAEFEIGDKVQFAKFDPEKEKAADPAP